MSWWRRALEIVLGFSVLGVICCVVYMVVGLRELREEKRHGFWGSPAPSGSAAAPATGGASGAGASAGGAPTPRDAANTRASARKRAAFERCKSAGNVPALGFGYKVLCIKREAVVEVTDPEWPDEW